MLIIVVGAVASGGTDSSESVATESTPQASQREKSAAKTGASAKDAAAATKATAEDEPELTSGQKNALRAAENYPDTAPFSKAGLVQQLSSSAGDGHTKADATYAAANVDVDFNEQAVRAAKSYLETMPMSEDALVRQLSSSAGDKYTPAQARYGASKAQ